MLALVENHLQLLRNARTDADIVRVLLKTAQTFGFRSAYLVEYDKAFNASHILDTDARRGAWWQQYFASYVRPRTEGLHELLASSTIMRFGPERFNHPPDDQMADTLRANDLADVVIVPINDGGDLVGLLGFCGTPELDSQDDMALQLIGYTVMIQSRSLRQVVPGPRPITLTPREKEVVRLSAEGMTSHQIADRLGMSTRTANQHFDNVSDKLGTKNRAHTVAEVIRHDLLN